MGNRSERLRRIGFALNSFQLFRLVDNFLTPFIAHGFVGIGKLFRKFLVLFLQEIFLRLKHDKGAVRVIQIIFFYKFFKIAFVGGKVFF